MLKQLHFFAATGDLASVLVAVETKRPLKYVRFGQQSGEPLETIHSGLSIPSLGRASAGSSINCDTYIVAIESTSLKPRTVVSASGVERTFVDQLANPDTVVLSLGGVWGDEAIIAGRIGTSSSSPLSVEIMSAFGLALRKQFRRVKSFYVGSGAHELLEKKWRLTTSIDSPREFDLSID